MVPNNPLQSSSTTSTTISGTFFRLRVTKGKLTSIIFYVVFFLVFGLSGLLSFLSILKGFPYRMGFVSSLVLPLIILYGFKINKILIAYILLTLVVFASGLYNHISLEGILLFMRTLIFSYLILRLVEIFLRPTNVFQVLKWCLILSVIQLPVILLQRLSYNYWPAIVRNNIIQLDSDFGTFNFKGDAPMAFFLISIIIFLLFEKQRYRPIKYKWIILSWLTLTVLISNAEVTKIIIAMVWGIYFVTHARAKIIIYSVIAFLGIFGLLAMTGSLNQAWSRFRYNLQSNTQLSSEKEQSFLSGNYARGTAVAYYLNQKIKLLGDGPSKYYNVFTKTRMVGNTGHIFTFYSEVGLLGWLLSAVIFFLIAFPIHQGRIKIGWVPLLLFISIQLLSFTSEIMNDISIVLTYSLIIRVYWMLVQYSQVANSGNPIYEQSSGSI